MANYFCSGTEQEGRDRVSLSRDNCARQQRTTWPDPVTHDDQRAWWSPTCMVTATVLYVAFLQEQLVEKECHEAMGRYRFAIDDGRASHVLLLLGS